MSLTWQLVKTFSRLHPHWRASVKQYENFHKKEHYYSPIPLISEVQRAEERIFSAARREFAGIDLNLAEQLRAIEEIGEFYGELPFSEAPAPPVRFYLDNKFYPYTDAVLYYGMLRRLRPRNVVEIGSGFSSAVLLDTNESFFQSSIQSTFIEPDTSRLDRLLTDQDRGNVTIIRQLVQDLPTTQFSHLTSNDILFVDSSHVCKVGSDLNYILFDILPSLASGVYIHFHDIFYPFEYPKEWIYRGVAWNEAYLLRAFLQYNPAFRIVAWSDYLQRFHEQDLTRKMPLCRRNSGSFWLRKV